MNRLIYSILLAILLTLNLTSVLMAAPTYAPIQVQQVTADITVLSPLNTTDQLLLGKNISIYINDCCLLAIINLDALLDQGVQTDLTTVLFTPDPNWWGFEVLRYIDLNHTTDGFVENPDTGVEYAIVRVNASTVILAIDLSSVDLSDVMVYKETYDEFTWMNLYEKALWLRVRDYNPIENPDSALSENRFAVIVPEEIDWDNYINVKYYINETAVDKAKNGTFVKITVTLPDEIQNMITIEDPVLDRTYRSPLTFKNITYFNLTMRNLDDPSDSDWLVAWTEGPSTLTVNPANTYFASLNANPPSDTELVITGYVQDFSPGAVHEDGSNKPKAFYVFYVDLYIEINNTIDADLSDILDCPNVVDSNTYRFYYEEWGDTSDVYVEIWTSLVYNDFTNMSPTPDGVLNPGDIATFILYNVPEDAELEYVEFTTVYTTIITKDFTDGAIDDHVAFYVTIPNGTWGGLLANVTFVFNVSGYLIRVGEHPDCYQVNLTVEPYFLVGTLPNSEDLEKVINETKYWSFVDWSSTDYTAAPGDYLLVKGYGFITEEGLHVYINETLELEKLLEVNSTYDPDLDPGVALLVVRLPYEELVRNITLVLYDAVMVVDSSNTMADPYRGISEILIAKNATAEFINSVVKDCWYVALTAFNTTVFNLTGNILKHVPDEITKTKLNETLDLISPGGETYMDLAIYNAVNLLNTGRERANKIILLVSDGLPANRTRAEEAAAYAHSLGITIIGVFVGDPSTSGDEFLESISDIFINVSAREDITNLSGLYDGITLPRKTITVTGCPTCVDNRLSVVGTLYSDTNYYSLADVQNLTIGFTSDLWKVFVNPGLFYNATEQKIYVTEELMPYFDVYYDLVDDPLAPGGDKFVVDTWDEEFRLEIIGFNTSSIDLVFNNTWPHGYNFTWKTIELTCGYAYIDLTGETIPFLPYGSYTVTILNGTIPRILNAVKNRGYDEVFFVHPNLDIDVLPDDDTTGRKCCNVTISMVGGLPDDILSLSGSASIYINSELLRSEDISVDIETDIYGTGSVTVSGQEYFYNLTELQNDVHKYMDGMSLSGSGDIFLEITYSGWFNSFRSDYYGVTSDYGEWDTNTERGFTLTINGTVHYYDIVDEINWTASIKIPRVRVTVTVPETILPGDNITVQIVVHMTDIPPETIVPEYIWDILAPYWIDIRLVDLSSSTGGEWRALYGGWLSFDSRTTEVVLPNGKVAKLVRVKEDVDGDGKMEIVFLAVIPAPLVSHDMTLRVDVNVTLAFKDARTKTYLSLTEDNETCTFEANYTGSRYWPVQYTGILYGGDHQLTTVLGLLEAKLDYINGTTVYIKAKVNDIWTYITIDLRDFLEAMNNSIITKIDDSTVTILTELGEINVSLTDLMLTLASEIELKVDESTATIIAKLEDVNETLYLKIEDESDRVIEALKSYIESALNETLEKLDEVESSIVANITYWGDTLEVKIDNVNETLHLAIQASREDLEDLITTVYSSILDTITSAEEEIIANITYWGDTLEMKVDAVNETLYLKIDESFSDLESLISDLETTILGRLDELEANVISTVLAVNSSIIRHIDIVADDLRYDILLRIDEAESTLSDLVTVKADEIKYFINETATTIIAKIGESTLTITDAIDSAEADLEVYIDGQTATIRSDIAAVKTDTESIIDLVNALQTSVSDLSAKLIQVNDTLYALVLSVGDDVKATIVGKADDILGFLNEFKTSTDTGFSNVLSTIDSLGDELTAKVESTKNAILTNLSGVYSDLSSKLDDVSSAISSARTSIEGKITSAKDELGTKADTLAGDLKKTVEDKTDAVNSNVTTFSLVLLILIVVLIGLVGYNTIAARKVR